MLLQLIHWSAMAGTVLEGLILIRMLSLKLQRLYTFLTLYWVVNIIFDAGAWALGWETPQADALELYSLFVLALLFPICAWDVFEEMKPAINKLRLMQGSRMLSGLFATLFVTAILFAFTAPADPDKDVGFAGLAPIVWFGSACASMLFLWTLRYFLRKQALVVPQNTGMWLHLFLILIGCNVVNAFGLILALWTPVVVLQSILIVLNAVTIVAMIWALVKMRGVPSETSPEPQKASL